MFFDFINKQKINLITNLNIAKMKKILFIAFMLFCMGNLNAQNILWQKCLGGSDGDGGTSIQKTTDGGYITGGSTSSNDGDVSGNNGAKDYWVVKTDSLGALQWQKCLGGSSNEYVNSIQQTTDSGYIIAGYTESNDGDVTGYHGNKDYWIVKIDSIGALQWQKCLGGTGWDIANSVRQTTDGGYIVAGFTGSNDGDVTGYIGWYDCWIVKLDSLGTIQWQKCLGGSDNDQAQSIRQTTDGGYIFAGYTWSDNGDVSGHHGNGDYWVVKIDSLGALQWQSCLGGTARDMGESVEQTSDAGYIIAGATESNDGDVSDHHGSKDYWIVKLDSLGVLQWQKCLGGSSTDVAESIKQTTDAGYIIAGYTLSNDGDVPSSNYGTNFWIVKLSSQGVLLWQKCLGGSSWSYNYGRDIQQITDSSYIILGSVKSNDGDVSGNHGNYDRWIVKLQGVDIISQEIELSTGWNIMSSYVVPGDMDMLNIVQPLVSSNNLIKVFDESGGFIQDIPPGGWMNTIGNMANTEGYYIKVAIVDALSIIGTKAVLPYEIPLQSGWNIMGYPVNSSQNAMNIFNQLIAPDSTLIKVLNEAGNFIQYIPSVGWMNTIDSLCPNEGYYIRVNANDTLTLSAPLKSYRPMLNNIVVPAPVHFLSITNNPYTPMNFVVTKIISEGFEVQNGDEIAVYDENIKVGSAVITQNRNGLQIINARADDPLTENIDGFGEGNNILFKYWDNSNNKEYDNINVSYNYGENKFAGFGTSVCELKINTIGIHETSSTKAAYLGQNYPNPFSNETTIEYCIAKKGNVSLNIFDISGRKLMVLVNNFKTKGKHLVTFNKKTLKPGVYYYKLKLSNKHTVFSDVKKMVIK
jgi:Secretion system C-terminal sorting domain